MSKLTLTVRQKEGPESLFRRAKSKANPQVLLELKQLETNDNINDMRTLLAMLDKYFNLEFKK